MPTNQSDLPPQSPPTTTPEPTNHTDLPPQSLSTTTPEPTERPLLSQRAFTILLGAAAIGATAGFLTYEQSHSVASAVTAGGSACFFSLSSLHKLIG